MSARGDFCGGSGFVDRKGNCRNPDGCTCDTIATLREQVEKMRVALARQTDNVAFILNHVGLPPQWFEKFDRELTDDRAALPKEPS